VKRRSQKHAQDRVHASLRSICARTRAVGKGYLLRLLLLLLLLLLGGSLLRAG